MLWFVILYIGTGLQEYIEAVSFLYYLKEGSLISMQQVQQDLVFEVDLNKVRQNVQSPQG